MPIAELSEARRIGRDFKVRLGVRWKRTAAGRVPVRRTDDIQDSYPSETDYFVLDDDVPEDVRELYQREPRSLRIMLYNEWDALGPDGDELVFNLNNRAYGLTRGLRCKGTGRSAEAQGTAVTDDRDWATRIERATGVAPEPLPSLSGTPRFRVRCLGRDCPKYLHLTSQPDPDQPAKTKQLLAPGHDRDASCKVVAILRAMLLHPTTDAASPDYCKGLGVMELATGSINSIVDLQSDFDLKLRAFTGGRTAGVPVTLVRKPTTTYKPFRQVHHTCGLRIDQAEAQRWAAVPISEVFLSESQREVLKRLQSTPLGLTVDTVAGLLPDRLVPDDVRGPQTAKAASTTEESRELADARLVDPGAQAGQSEPGPFLVAAQLAELKALAGGLEDPTRPWNQVSNPWRPEAIARLKAAIRAMNEETGSEVDAFAKLRVEDADWLKRRLAELPPVEEGGA